MNAPQTESLHSRLETLIALARLLERVEASPQAIGADQYRSLVGQIKTALAPALPQQALEAILDAHPATAEIYENQHYPISGLSRSIRAITESPVRVSRSSAGRDQAIGPFGPVNGASSSASMSARPRRPCAPVTATRTVSRPR